MQGRSRLRFLLGDRAPVRLVVVSLLAGACEAVVLVLLVRLALSVGGDDTVDFLGLDRGLAVGLGAVALVVLVGLHYLAARDAAEISNDTTRRVRTSVVEAYLRASWTAQRRIGAGELQELVGNGASAISQASLSLAWGIVGVLVIAVLAVTALVLDPFVSLVLFALGAGLLLLLRPIPRLSKRSAAEALLGNTRFVGWIAHLPRLGQEIRLYGVGEAVEGRITEAEDIAGRGRTRQRLVFLLGPSLFKDGAVFVLLLVLFVAGALPETSAARVGAVVLLLVRALVQAQSVYSVHQQYVTALPHLDVYEATLRDLRASPRPHGAVDPGRITEVRAEGLAFTYDDGRAALRGVDLTVVRGEMLGVVGPSGAGKSTLVAALLGLAPPTAGRVLVNGIPLDELDLAAWSRAVGVVPQDPELIDGSVADNIRFFRAGVSEEAVEAAARAAHVHDDVVALPDGYATSLAEGGGLSGGQRQRVALARALVGGPQLLVLDEPTAALDPRTEGLVRETLAERRAAGTTIVVVAHRPTTLQACDRIVVVEEGRVLIPDAEAR